MNRNLIKDIISILNQEQTLENKCLSIRALCKYRKGENRTLLNFICNVLSPYILPLKHSEPLDINLINELSEKNYFQLEKIKNESNCTYFNAICNEVLWMHNHKLDFARDAISEYFKELSNPADSFDSHFNRFSVSLCRIYSKCKIADFDFESFYKNVISYIKSNYDMVGFSILFILDALYSCKLHKEEIENLYIDIINYSENQKNYYKAIGFLKHLEKNYSDSKRQAELKSIRIRIACDYEYDANKYVWNDPKNSHRIVSLIHKAMSWWDKVGDKKAQEERKRLAKAIIPVKELSLKSLQSIKTGPIDISEYINNINDFIDKSSLEVVLYRLAHIISLKSYDKLKEELKNSGYIASFLFSARKLDSDGRVKCIVPSFLGATEEEICLILEHNASKEYLFSTDAFIRTYVLKAKEKFSFTKDDLRFLVEDNIFIPENRKETFLNGIVAGFNLELSTAMHLLMPQVENSIRNMAQECGAVVYKTDKDGVESCLGLKSILTMPEVEECFDETFLFNLKLFYISEYGFGMRNAVCHSLYSDDELQTNQSLAVWWFTFHICCMFSPKLHKRLLKEDKK